MTPASTRRVVLVVLALLVPFQLATVATAAPDEGSTLRRAGDLEMDETFHFIYGTRCHAANTSFTDASCNCLGKGRHPKFDSRPRITVIVGTWTASALDAFFLKIMIEEDLGWPVRLMLDNDAELLKMEGGGVKFAGWSALANGNAHLYPEVWKSEEGEAYDRFVREKASVASSGPLGVLGRNGWYCLESDVARWPALAGWRGLLDPEVRTHFNKTFFSYGTSGVDEDSWGPNRELMDSLGVGFDFVFMGTNAEEYIRARLGAGLSSIFYLWVPHALQKRFELSRIQLPVYGKARFDAGQADYPIDVLEKVYWPGPHICTGTGLTAATSAWD